MVLLTLYLEEKKALATLIGWVLGVSRAHCRNRQAARSCPFELRLQAFTLEDFATMQAIRVKCRMLCELHNSMSKKGQIT
jgi:hypothetical protein